jgi:signal transduction histidine kinase
MTAQAADGDADGRWRRIRRRLLAVLLRPTARPLGWGIVVAVGFILGEAAFVLLLKRTAPDNSYGAIFLLGVLVVAAGWNFGLALATSLVSAAVYVYFHVEDGDNLIPAFFVFLPLALLASVLASQARLRAAESEERRREANALAQQQAALRRVATLVARGVKPEELYPVAVTELARGLACEHVTLVEFDGDDHGLMLATQDMPGRTQFEVGERLPLDGDSLSARIRETGAPARIDDYALVDGTIATRLRDIGLHSGVGAPITIDGTTRGALIIGSAQADPMSGETEARIGDFADLVATAIANAETRAELRASRARVVAAADQARRGIERDLHDGAQQRIVSLGLGLRALEATIPPEQQAMRKQVDNLVTGMADLYTELQELSRGIHPAILSKGGLGPALKTLARRSTIPVALHLDVDGRLPESIEVAAYYVVAEALTNAAKHSRADGVTVRAGFDNGDLRLEVADDGVGGATPGASAGSGLIGLKDRVDAVSGRLVVSSPASGGTVVSARIPVDVD